MLRVPRGEVTRVPRRSPGQEMAVAQVAMKQEPQSPPPSHPPTFPTPPSTSGTPQDPLGLERILTLCAQNSKGISDDIIVQDQPTIDGEKE